MADTLEQVEASERKKASAPAPAPAPSNSKKRRRINLPEGYPKQGFSLGEMPLTLFILIAGAIVYLHLSGKGSGKVLRRQAFDAAGNPVGEPAPMTQREATGYEGTSHVGPVTVQPPKVDLPPGEHLVPVAPGTPVPTLNLP